MRRRRFALDPVRAFQVGFLALLAICAAQVVYWMIDEVVHTRRLTAQLTSRLDEQIQAARRLADLGVDPNEVDRLFPELTFSSGPERITVNPRILEDLQRERARRVNRYGWEGAFFLVVLVAAMGVIARALHQDWQLRRRQQNFLAAVTHEFKSPLASLRLAAETLALRDPPPPLRQKLVARLLEDLERLDGMIGNILDTARLDEGRVPLRPEAVPLAEAVRALFEEVGERAKAARVTLELDAPEELEARADPVAVRTVLRNLVDNAIKATAASGGGVVRVIGRAEGGAARVDVQDTGVGFPPGEADRLFEKFYRLGDELRRTSRGSGLGLYIVRRFVQLTGGHVGARSEGPGRGAVFTVLWPAPRADATS